MNYEGLQNQRQNIRKYLSGKKAFSTDSLLIARPRDHSPAFDYDTDHSIQAVDVEIMISTAGSGLDPS